MTRKEAQALIQRYIDGTCTAEEKVWVERWCNEQFDQSDPVSSADMDAIGEIIAKRLPVHQKRRINRSWLVAAAVAGLATSSGIAFYLNNETSVIHQQQVVHDIAPGGDQAYLTLHTGEVIPLAELEHDTLLTQTGISVSKTANGELIYTVTEDSSEAANPLAYNSVSTPKGGQFQVQLPDGTKVWLNASSSITYPTSFSSAAERKITLHGEAYFEVARDPAKPFIVQSPKQDVEVLGTHFNVNAYEDEAKVTTTLLEGSVNVHVYDESKAFKLVPGQQSIVQPGESTSIAAVDLSEAIGWKNGEFVFYDETIEMVMNDISRWYDVDVVYKDAVQQKVIWGSVSKFENISKVLKMIELTGVVHFDIQIDGDGRRVYVMK